MCTYSTVTAGISGSAKGPGTPWMHVTDLSVYFDHPVHARDEHTVNIDVTDPALGPSARVALELSASSARRLADAIRTALDSVPPELTGGTLASP